MRKFFAAILLGGMILAGVGLLRATATPSFCPMHCCHGPQDCPTPSCCARK